MNPADAAIDWIERRLARAFGQYDFYHDMILAGIALQINEWAEFHNWGTAIRERFLAHPNVGPYINLLEDETKNRLYAGALKNYCDNDPQLARLLNPELAHAVNKDGDLLLSEEQKKLVRDHYPLVRKVARQFARHSAAWRDDLVTHLNEKAISLAHRYDRARGVTFGAFIQRRLMGAARDYIKHRPRTVTIEPNQIDIALRDKTRKLPKQPSAEVQTKHWSMGDKRLHGFYSGKSTVRQRASHKELDAATAKFREGGGIIKRHGEPCIPEYLKAPLAKLNPRQRAVYTGTVLTDPPISRYRLALELGIRDMTQISRIKRQAERKMWKLLKPKVSPPAGI